MRRTLLIITIVLFGTCLSGQSKGLNGTVSDANGPIPYSTIQLKELDKGAVTDENGRFDFQNIPSGRYTLIIKSIGYKSYIQEIEYDTDHPIAELNVVMEALSLELDPVVITGTKTGKRQTKAPIIVNVISSATLNEVQACNLSEGLRFQPGLRIETDCQTCNYTQLRMNGLGGGYSQILINGRPIFSPLTGLYGLEQIPVNMIDRIETVRGGGSSLYGSSAIGGTVNVITKIPRENSYELGFTRQLINNSATDNIISGNASIVNEKKVLGASIFMNIRDREMYDHNGDQFSEIPKIENESFGTNIFYLPADNQKIELSLSKIHEYRYGGEMIDAPPHLAQQAEERTHNVLLGSLDYQLNFNQEDNSFIAYFAGQQTTREHYTGIFPDEELDIFNHLENPPYGSSENLTYQGGVQLNHKLKQSFIGTNVISLGGEYIVDDIYDEIESYNYLIDQQTKNAGAFLQSDWELNPSFNLLTGLRLDQHNLVDRLIYSPRMSLLYKHKSNTQLRLTWSSGFRAPQAFDADLHIAFAGGGISRVTLSPDLSYERSQSISGSVNFDKASEKWVAGFTLEGFYTRLNDAFYLEHMGEDAFGEIFEKRNGPGAVVKGITLETRANFNNKGQIEAGYTLQSSLFDQAVENIEGLAPTRKFMRTPDDYAYATISVFPNNRFTAALNAVYTGSMIVTHFAGSPEQAVDEYTETPRFLEIGIKTSYNVPVKKEAFGLQIFAGVKNIGNAYQSDFDTQKNRDSNYIYGPGIPRIIFMGIKFLSL